LRLKNPPWWLPQKSKSDSKTLSRIEFVINEILMTHPPNPLLIEGELFDLYRDSIYGRMKHIATSKVYNVKP